MSEHKHKWLSPSVLAGVAGVMGALGTLSLAGIAGVIPLQKPAWMNAPLASLMQPRPVSQALVRGLPVKLAMPLSSWRMDHTLSLGLLKPHDPSGHGPAPQRMPDTRVSLSGSVNLADDEGASQDHLDDDPPQVQAKADVKVDKRLNLDGTGILMIDPPAAGHMPSGASQAAQALQDSDLLYQQAQQLVAAGANEQALTVLQGLDHPDGDALGLKAGLLAQAGRYAPAAAAYEQALKTRPDNATWWLGLGVAWNAQGQSAMAKEAFIRARRLGQLSPDVQAWLDQQL